MHTNIIAAARRYMGQRTKQNKVPAWLLTEIAIAKAKELFLYYPKANKQIVLAALYLAHTHFGIERRQQHGHVVKSAALAKKFLKKFRVSQEFTNKVINSIEAHHGHVPCESVEAEIVKNAEAFKFLTLKGALVMLHDCGIRGWNFEKSRDYTLFKMEQKYKSVTLSRCKREAIRARGLIKKTLNS